MNIKGFFIYIINKFISILDYIDFNCKVSILKYFIMYFIIFTSIYFARIIYEFLMYIMQKTIMQLLSKGRNFRNLKFVIMLNEFEFKIRTLFDKITLENFDVLDLLKFKCLPQLLPNFAISLVFINFITYISSAILIIYLNNKAVINEIVYITNNSSILFGNMLLDISNIQFDKEKIIVTIVLFILAIIWGLNKLKYKGYSKYEQFEISLKELEKEKINKVVKYQEEILEILNELYYIFDNNLTILNDILINLDSDGINNDLKPFQADIKKMKKYSDFFEKLNLIMKNIEEEKSIKVFNNYNKEFCKECSYLGLVERDNLYFKKLQELDIDNIINTFFTKNKNFKGDKKHKIGDFECKVEEYRYNTIKYSVYIRNYLIKLEKRRNKIMKYTKFNSKLKEFEDKLKVFK